MEKNIVCGIVVCYSSRVGTKCLMLRRSLEVNNPLVWSFPMGHADPPEQELYYALIKKRDKYEILIDVMLRELKEETGLSRDHIGSLSSSYLKISKRKKNIYFFFSNVNKRQYDQINEDIVLNFENDDFKWFDVDTFSSECCFHPFINKNFDLFLEIINDESNPFN